MSETTSPALERFILHWGEMGVRWGINRSVAQVQAFLILAPEPVPAEVISDALGIARSNVSTSLKELQGWGLVKVVHVSGDRKDHFQALSDPWEMFRVVASERKKRELDPSKLVISECLSELKKEKGHNQYADEKLSELLSFFEAVFGFYDQLQRLQTPSLKKFAKMGSKVFKGLGLVGLSSKKI